MSISVSRFRTGCATNREFPGRFAKLGVLGACLVPGLAFGIDGPSTPPADATADATAQKAERPKPSDNFPLSGSLDLSYSIDGGTFVPGEQQRAGADASVALGAAYKITSGLSFSAKQRLDKNIETNGDRDQVHLYQTTLFDTALSLSWSPQTMNADGKSEAMKLPGGFGFSAGLGVELPVSRDAKFATRWLKIASSISLKRAIGIVTVAYGSSFAKNFNQYPNRVLHNEPGSPGVLPRQGGAEGVGPSDVLLGIQNSSFFFRQSLSVDIKASDRLSFAAGYYIFNNFGYQSFPKDEYTSEYAKPGRMRRDTQWGTLDVSYSLGEDKLTSVSLGTFTASPPYSADNKTLRFPFWDFRSLSDNYSSVSVGLARSF